MDACGKLGRTIKTIREDGEQTKVEYKNSVEVIPEEEEQAVKEKCSEERPKAEIIVKDKLLDKHGDIFNEEAFETMRKAVDKISVSAEKTREFVDVTEKVTIKLYHHQ